MPVIALIVLLDEWVKWQALHNLPNESAIIKPEAVVFAIHKNWGIAFDIPFKMPLIILISIVIGAALLWVAARNALSRPIITFAALMIVIGAAGNLYDRLAYGFTVDYIILLGRSAINISDIVIVSGVITLLSASRVRNGIDKCELPE
ncbi:hypothetical protein A2348_01735 [Candidatus Uhrbacteria bacterium RIFOXYB12_FULL_58_10]|uniref:Uncharacterized protein n=1 Tax=Candidatus Uhrbacteria bacterium RIFOXYB2_FULL_57_15 TaxID=1802422 RepID=A0A1F7W961_9BACT|nr:MAG: hypothetical protein A2348_01735 [Candidatus Uhrbacteria bacterium RIFOXYB12_FULL_58_10]OGL99365.1 MAG: hypothetical protein A2304_00110 [Candidatus Uhrbacteria bacterium RIFOXYB2_FULL_57_15]OGM00497.1 MAG: hypothetical protein A2501_00855 [Candidatus Uhrbacteria bacterium RIFOXYC12_FULL_57_11]